MRQDYPDRDPSRDNNLTHQRLENGKPVLTCSQQLPRPAQAQVLFGDSESIHCGFHSFQPAAGIFGHGVVTDEYTGG